MSEHTRLKLNLFHSRKGEQPEALELYYVLGHKPAGGIAARVLMDQAVELRPDDVLVFDFTTEKVCTTERCL